MGLRARGGRRVFIAHLFPFCAIQQGRNEDDAKRKPHVRLEWEIDEQRTVFDSGGRNDGYQCEFE